jgi:hypothetical protein
MIRGVAGPLIIPQKDLDIILIALQILKKKNNN